MKRLLLVDACNLLHRIPELAGRMHQGVDAAAEQLLQLLRPLHDLGQWELHLVVDGCGPRAEQQFHDPARTLSILYAPAHASADTLIETWLLRLGPDWQVRVASEDHAIARAALAHGAESLSARQLLDWLRATTQRFQRQQQHPPPSPRPPFGNPLAGLP